MQDRPDENDNKNISHPQGPAPMNPVEESAEGRGNPEKTEFFTPVAPPPTGDLPERPPDHPAPPMYNGPSPGRRRPRQYTTGPRPRYPGMPEQPPRQPRPPRPPHGEGHPDAHPRRPSHPPGSYPRRRIEDIDRTDGIDGRVDGRVESRFEDRRESRKPPEEEHVMTGPIGRKRPRRRARRRTQMAAMYIFFIVAAVGISLTVFAMTFPRLFDPDRTAYAATVTPSPTPSPTPLPLNTRSLTGMVTGISGNNVSMLDVSNNQTRTFSLIESTTLSDRYGNEIDLTLLSVGNIMNSYYNPDTDELFRLRQTFTRNLTPADFRVDAESSTVTVGNDIFHFTNQTLILHRGEPFHLADISPDDTVTLVTLDGIIWLIDVAYGHGFLQFSNIEDVIDGRAIMELLGHDIRTFGNLEDRIPLTEGTYRVTVEGRNIDPFITEIEIRQGETTTIDLSDVQPGKAVLELTVTPHGSRVYINEELTSLHSAMEFEFGEAVSIRVEREGYYTEERTITMDQAIVSINITLEEETPVIEMGNLFVTAMPAGAHIWINNQFLGFAPLSVELYLGSHFIQAFADGHYDYEANVEVLEGENSVVIFMTPIVEETQDIPIPTPPPAEYDWPPPPPYEPQPPYDPPPYDPPSGYYNDGYE